MIKKLWRSLFQADKNQARHTNDSNTKNEVEDIGAINTPLNNRKVETVIVPDFGDQEGLTITKWYVRTGDIVKKGAIICKIENKNISLEFESLFSGQIITTCPLNQKLKSGMKLFTIERV